MIKPKMAGIPTKVNNVFGFDLIRVLYDVCRFPVVGGGGEAGGDDVSLGIFVVEV